MNVDNNTTNSRNNAVNSITGKPDYCIANLRIPSSVLDKILFSLKLACSYCKDISDIGRTDYDRGMIDYCQIFNDIYEHLTDDDYLFSMSNLSVDSKGDSDE